jgi:1-acyl-sn-glycerol-3-phosphate acyltransferase
MNPYSIAFPYDAGFFEEYLKYAHWELHTVIEKLLVLLARLLSGVTAHWIDNAPTATPRVYIANHSSHIDFLLIWSALPSKLRQTTVPVAAKDYWQKGLLRRYIVKHVFRTLVINRKHVTLKNNPVEQLRTALRQRQSIILFPEGTRSPDGMMREFKSGIYHLAKAVPQVEFVPVFVKNAHRVLPKGALLPVPTLCSVTFGAPFRLDARLDKRTCLVRAREAVKCLQSMPT